ncbi:hypothetical protein CASFOL_001391 [Castilleja foliolosa]|uniref:Uncharacterized protein n=1 Tax=Castilleja foliolosa TaxID=1961234 RepID=A0ABD3ECE8_9LAMI
MHDHILHVLTIPAEAACSFIALGEMAVCVCLWIAKIMYVQSCSTNTLKEVTSQCF